MSSAFSESAKRLSVAFAMDGHEVARRDHEHVREGLRRSLVSRFHTLGADELLDIIDETIARLLRESRRQSGALDNPAGWLVKTAHNRAVDRMRSLAREQLAQEDRHDDDESARLISRVADHDMLSQGIETAIRCGDRVCVHGNGLARPRVGDRRLAIESGGRQTLRVQPHHRERRALPIPIVPSTARLTGSTCHAGPLRRCRYICIFSSTHRRLR